MDKRAVERYMPMADEAIKTVFGNEKIDKTYRSKLSAFGAAVIMSGLLPALAYYKKNEEKVIKLLENMYEKKSGTKLGSDGLFGLAKNEKDEDLKELIINFSISLKLVMNLYI